MWSERRAGHRCTGNGEKLPVRERAVHMKIFGRNVEGLVFWWTLGLVIAYAFLIWLIVWLVFQGILMYQAYLVGNFSYISWKLERYLVMAVAYFSIAVFLRAIRFI